MKKLFTVISLLISLSAFSQTADDYLQSGLKKHKAMDYKGAIDDYSKAIKADPNNRDACFNRGNCELALQDYKDAKADFDKTIVIDPKFAKAYYNRATVFSSQEKYTEALPDLDKTIELDSTMTNALTLRGQIRATNGNRPGACEDFNRAKRLGNEKADKYIAEFCGNEQKSGESLVLDWPDSEGWKVGNTQDNDKIVLVELVRGNETLDKWTEMGNMMSIKGAGAVPVDTAMGMMYKQLKQDAPKAKLTIVEKNETGENPWIIFTIESPRFKDDKNPESQLWYIVAGKQALYTNFWAIKKASIPADMKAKWTRFFKTGKVVMK